MSRAGAPSSLVLIGASGRMGTSLLRLLPQFPSLRLQAAICSRASPSQGRDSGELAGMPPSGIPITAHVETALAGAGVVLDFSTPTAAAEHVRQCGTAAVPLLLGTTGHAADLAAALESASRRTPILVAPNTSLGATVLIVLARRAAAALGTGYGVLIEDRHHKGKRDAPSGTALALGAAVQVGGEDRPRQVDYRSIREGEAAGSHTVQFSGPGESLCLRHDAGDRVIFARGALRAALWLVGRPPGRYKMADLIEEK